jgi:hypothetical protein
MSLYSRVAITDFDRARVLGIYRYALMTGVSRWQAMAETRDALALTVARDTAHGWTGESAAIARFAAAEDYLQQLTETGTMAIYEGVTRPIGKDGYSWVIAKLRRQRRDRRKFLNGLGK